MILQAIGSLERTLVTKREELETAGEKSDKPGLNPQLYCILGHLQLLLENFPKGKLIPILDSVLMAIVKHYSLSSLLPTSILKRKWKMFSYVCEFINHCKGRFKTFTLNDLL